MRRPRTHQQPSPTHPRPAPPSDPDLPARLPTPPDLTSWARRWGSGDERVLLAANHAHAAQLNRLARDALRADGTIGGPVVSIGGLDLVAGDRVVVEYSSGRTILEPGAVADVRLVDPAGQWVVLDVPTAGTVRLAGTGLESVRLRFAYTFVRPVRQSASRMWQASPARIGPEVGLA